MFGMNSGLSSAKMRSIDMLRANVMIADSDLRITYMNTAVKSLLAEVETELKAELPRFSMETLLGSNIDVFHKNPSYQRDMLAKLTKPHSATIRVGGHAFDLLVTPLMDNGKSKGFVVEWSNAKERLLNNDYRNQMEAISRVQAVISFSPDGHILSANENFQKSMGYSLGEIVGKHHSMFVDKDYAASQAYQDFWRDMRDGKFRADEFVRYSKSGKPVYLQASYNPIMDEKGKVMKVVKFATDVTDRVNAVNTLGDGLKELAAGNLDQQIDTPFPQNLERLRHDFNDSVKQLEAAINSIGSNANNISASAEEVRSAADSLSKRTEQQAASIEETAAALEEITTTVADSSRRAEEAGQLVARTRENAERSGEVVKEAIEAMSAIENSSGQIANIIGVIDEIAFQTNLLALNAGVEAARAGDAGKGFAVVATEVRELAQRSANAAKEIKSLITKSSDQVKQGVALVGRTGAALADIVVQVQDINRNVNAIVDAAREQATGLKEVNAAVNTMDQGTQQNAAMVEESNAQSATLANEAEALASLLQQFRTRGSAQAARRAAPGRAPQAATSASRPAASPARQLASKVARSFATGGAATAAATDWEEF
ncbi:methyl-accepting chemotaxis sensory transducer with Pas/Pac sensor [Ensifer adhaerens]|nr:methyl-accepting chemotaxis sensory transducer with Pas/Pac sensor [Ensifer adhaerens]HZG30791.1 methyl-accepting chemotaxis protein [Ensifer sp.]